MTPASPPPGPPRVHPAALWLGPPVARGDASITAGVFWLAALVAALWAGAAVFGLAVSAVAAGGAWQAASVRSSLDATSRTSRDQAGTTAVRGAGRYRLPAAALAGAVGLAGVVDTRLAGAVLGAAVMASFIVVGLLGGDRSAPRGARPRRDLSPAMLARTGLLVRCWMQVGVAAACAAAVARYSLGAALVLIAAAASYDAGAYVTAAERRPGLRGPVVGAVAAAAAVFALTGVSVPPFAPADAVRYGVIAALTLPLGPALARTITDPVEHSRRRGLERLRSPWAVRRLDSLSITSLAWMWGLGLLAV